MIGLKQFKHILAVMAVSCGLTANAQQFTANHDPTKMNQITVQETGVGVLMPAVWYQATHSKYYTTAQARNKSISRAAVGATAFNQVELAEKVDSSLYQRAKIETLNVADRAVDVAWQIEQRKIEDSMSNFQRNINRIMVVGGNTGQTELWNLEYQKFSTAIKAIREAYMPNSQRKKQYIRIYNDICKSNETLVKFLVYLQNSKSTGNLLTATYRKPDNRKSISQSAATRWRANGWKVVPCSNK